MPSVGVPALGGMVPQGVVCLEGLDAEGMSDTCWYAPLQCTALPELCLTYQHKLFYCRFYSYSFACKRYCQEMHSSPHMRSALLDAASTKMGGGLFLYHMSVHLGVCLIRVCPGDGGVSA